MDASQIVIDVMDEWKAGIDTQEPARVAAAFTQDAVFQGLRPYGVGHDAVAEYYDSQPTGMSVTYRVLESRFPASDVVLGYLAATFSYPDRPSVDLAIGVVLTLGGERWRVAQYQASRVPTGESPPEAPSASGLVQPSLGLNVVYRKTTSATSAQLHDDLADGASLRNIVEGTANVVE